MVLSTLARYDSQRLRVLSDRRRTDSLRVLRRVETAAGVDLANIDGPAVTLALSKRAARGLSPVTLSKERAIITAFCDWAYRARVIDAETLVSVRAVPAYATASQRAQPRPYARGELVALRSALDARWPLLPPDAAEHWLGRFRTGLSPYSRVRSHVVRCQLDAVISLALYLGLRRHEILALDVVTAHSANDQIVVRDPVSKHVDRVVPYTALPRAAIARWESCLDAARVEHGAMWLNAHAGPTVRQPLKPDRFNKLLATYVGPGWSLKRFRDTCAVAWLRAGLQLEQLCELLGLTRIEAVLPYAEIMRQGTLDCAMGRAEGRFATQVGPVVSGE